MMAGGTIRRSTNVTEEALKLESPIDAMYVIHHALRAEAARVETLVTRIEEGGSLQPFRQAF
jgi:hypothetical protein